MDAVPIAVLQRDEIGHERSPAVRAALDPAGYESPVFDFENSETMGALNFHDNSFSLIIAQFVSVYLTGVAQTNDRNVTAVGAAAGGGGMIKDHIHDLAFLEGGEGVYCMDADCDFRLSGDNLLSVLQSVCRRDDILEIGCQYCGQWVTVDHVCPARGEGHGENG